MPRKIMTHDGSSFFFRDYEPPPLGAHEVRLQERDEHYWLYVARVRSDS